VCFERPGTPSQNTTSLKGQVIDATPSGSSGAAALGMAQKELTQSTILDVVKSIQNNLLTKLSERMTRLIEANLSAPFPAVKVANPELVLGGDSLGRIPMFNMDGPSGSGRETPRSSQSDLSQRPDKVCHILNSWKLRFSGNPEGLSVDNFIYRAELS